MEKFTPDHLIVDDDFVIWFSLIVKQLNVHAPLKTRRVKAKRLPDWFTPDITEMQRKRDISRRLKMGRLSKVSKQIKTLIKHAKRKHFSETVDNCKDTKAIWSHLRTVTTGSKSSINSLPAELVINNERITNSENIASKLNKYFASVAEQFEKNDFDVFF